MDAKKNEVELEILVTHDGSATVLNKALKATYHSRFGALSESRHIFIHNGLYHAERLFGKRLRILEIGFGTGLNALLSLEETVKRDLETNYFSVEKYPLDVMINRALDYGNLIGGDGAALFRELVDAPWDKEVGLSGKFFLSKLKGDALTLAFPKDIDLVYFDAFGPGTSPEMWSGGMFARLFAAMKPRAHLVTFCASGQVKRNLKGAGFILESLAGPTGKREMTRAFKPLANSSASFTRTLKKTE